MLERVNIIYQEMEWRQDNRMATYVKKNVPLLGITQTKYSGDECQDLIYHFLIDKKEKKIISVNLIEMEIIGD